MYAVGGWIIDRLGTRRGLSLSLAVWSVVSMCHTFVKGVWGLCFSRFLLGTSQPGNFPAAIKGVSAWFPSQERGLAVGFALSGTGIGAIIAPPLVVWLALQFGWRMAFLIPSLVGLFWLPLWLYWYQHPTQHPRITEKELLHIQSDTHVETGPEERSAPSWKKMLRLPQTWSFILIRFFGDPLGYFFWYWLPSYLVSEKGFSFKEMGQWVWDSIPHSSRRLDCRRIFLGRTDPTRNDSHSCPKMGYYSFPGPVSHCAPFGYRFKYILGDYIYQLRHLRYGLVGSQLQWGRHGQRAATRGGDSRGLGR